MALSHRHNIIDSLYKYDILSLTNINPRFNSGHSANYTALTLTSALRTHRASVQLGLGDYLTLRAQKTRNVLNHASVASMGNINKRVYDYVVIGRNSKNLSWRERSERILRLRTQYSVYWHLGIDLSDYLMMSSQIEQWCDEIDVFMKPKNSQRILSENLVERLYGRGMRVPPSPVLAEAGMRGFARGVLTDFSTVYQGFTR